MSVTANYSYPWQQIRSPAIFLSRLWVPSIYARFLKQKHRPVEGSILQCGIESIVSHIKPLMPVWAFTQCGSRYRKDFSVLPIRKCALPGRPPSMPTKLGSSFMIRTTFSSRSSSGLWNPSMPSTISKHGRILCTNGLPLSTTCSWSKIPLAENSVSVTTTSISTQRGPCLHSFLCAASDCWMMKAISEVEYHSPGFFPMNYLPIWQNFSMLKLAFGSRKSESRPGKYFQSKQQS